MQNKKIVLRESGVILQTDDILKTAEQYSCIDGRLSFFRGAVFTAVLLNLFCHVLRINL